MKIFMLSLLPLYILFLFTVALPEASEKSVDKNGRDSTQIQVEIRIATDIQDRMPVGVDSIFNISTGKVYCWSVISGAREAMDVYHIWNYRGEQKSRVKIEVSSSYFRAYTFQTIERDQTGLWTVYVVDANNNVLGKACFTVESGSD